MFSYFLKGGLLMWPLLLFSVVSLAIIINRFIFYYRITHSEKYIIEGIKSKLQNNDVNGAVSVCKKHPGPLTAVLLSGLENIGKEPEVMEKAMEEAGLYVIPQLEKFLPALATIASISTLTGFTGTVTGMIKAFNSIAMHGASSPSVVARGISEALITTATGLIIAIPALVFYHYFSFKVNRFMLEIERSSKVLLKFGGNDAK